MIEQVDINKIVQIGQRYVDPQSLVCSICFNLTSNLVQCKNRICHKIYCEPCIKSSKMLKNCCPFCQTNVDYKRCDEKIYSAFSTMKLICEEKSCKVAYSYDDYLEHKKTEVSLKTIDNCKLHATIDLVKCTHCAKNACPVCLNYQKCINCKASLCEFCSGFKTRQNKSVFNEVMCGECSKTCDSCNTQESTYLCSLCGLFLCSSCSKFCSSCQLYFCKLQCRNDSLCESCTFKLNNLNQGFAECAHLSIIGCNNCFPKCLQSIYHRECNIFIGRMKCYTCGVLTCGKCINKCKTCRSIICPNCYHKCPCCKTNSCSACVDTCSQCNEFNSSICNSCNPDIFKLCKTCKKNLCINCWNLCENCNGIFCKNDIEKCINCEGNCCKDHFYNCSICTDSKDFHYKKLCNFRCTLKCDFCDSVSSTTCNPTKHQIVTPLICGHNACSSCIKKCGKCNKIVQDCRKCIKNYFFYNCRLCEIYLCGTCSKFCDKCEELYCPSNKCLQCGKNVGCLLCSEIKTCEFCVNNERLELCSNCKDLVFCGYSCKNKYKISKNLSHLCEKCGNCLNGDFNPQTRTAYEAIEIYQKLRKKENYEKVETNEIENRREIQNEQSNEIERKKASCCTNKCILF